MASDLGTTAQRYYINHGTLGSAALDEGSVFAWIYPTEAPAAAENIIAGKGDGSSRLDWRFAINWNTNNIAIRRNINGAADLRFTSTGSEIVQDAWNFVGGTWDINNTGNSKVYWGDLNTLVTEVAGYSPAQEAGSTNSFDVTGDSCYVGEWAGAGWATSFGGYIAHVSVCKTTIMGLTDFQQCQFRPHIFNQLVPNADRLLNVDYGWYTTTGSNSQIDLSGNAYHGTTVSSVGLAPHVPLPPAHAMFSHHHLTPPAAATGIPIFMHHYKQLMGAN